MSLGCGARVQEEAHRDTNSLHAYVGNVEAAAAGLLSCVQEHRLLQQLGKLPWSLVRSALMIPKPPIIVQELVG